ncbi:unnamed protein product [Echinostoma caproni]|uniref:Protein MAIN-LIKE 1-like n=1 Tax=Echinostoma caproni TaxID=27848 RepID=A0A183BDK3_9TREM|nr:unnamed protein product [Echinostoma caproni]
MSRCACCHLVPQNHPLIRRLEQCGEEAFGSVREFTNEQQLIELMRNAHALSLQPLLIRLRVLGPDHPDTIYFIRYRGAIYADADNFRQCLNLWRYAIELQRIFLEPLCHVSQAAFVSFAELFQFVLTNNYGGLPAVDLDPVLIVDCLELAVDNIERGMEYSFYQWHRRHPWSYTTADKEAINLMRHVVLCLHFIAMILGYYLPDLKPIPEPRPLRLASDADHSRSSDAPTERLVQRNFGYTSDLVDEQPVPTVAANPSADSQTRNRMRRLISNDLKERFIHQVIGFILTSFIGHCSNLWHRMRILING